MIKIDYNLMCNFEKHIIVFCTKSVFISWKNEELLYDSTSRSLIPVSSVVDKEKIFNSEDYKVARGDYDVMQENLRDNYRQSHPFYSYSDFICYGTDDDYTTFLKSASIIDGIEVVAFGEYLS